jgi:hypothetical protein
VSCAVVRQSVDLRSLAVSGTRQCANRLSRLRAPLRYAAIEKQRMATLHRRRRRCAGLRRAGVARGGGVTVARHISSPGVARHPARRRSGCEAHSHPGVMSSTRALLISIQAVDPVSISSAMTVLGCCCKGRTAALATRMCVTDADVRMCRRRHRQITARARHIERGAAQRAAGRLTMVLAQRNYEDNDASA